MRLVFEKSSNVATAELDESSGRVEVTFKSGARYRYEGFSRKDLEAWRDAPSAGVWFQRNLRPVGVNGSRLARCACCSARPQHGANLESGLCDDCEARAARPEVPPPEIPTTCAHALLAELAGGVCPVCNIRPDREESTLPVDVRPEWDVISDVAGGTPTQSEPDRKGRVTGASPVPPATVRPPLVEQPPSAAPSGAAHGPPAPESPAPAPAPAPASESPVYLKRALTRLTRAEATRLLLRLQARRMRSSLADFVKGAWHVLEGETKLEWNFHHDAFCFHAQIMLEEWILAALSPRDVGRRLELWERQGRPTAANLRAHWESTGRGAYKQRATDLAVNVGPISLKSRIFMVFVPAWMWLDTPHWEVFCSSGTPSNVSRDSLACRDLVTSSWYREQFSIEWTIRQDLDRVDKWGTTAGGTRESRGSGGSVTGIHADALLLDDPDDAAKVWSESERRDIMTFWLALGNRLKDPKRPLRIIIQQNLHEEDLSSRTVATGMPRLGIPVEFDPTRRAELYTAPYGWRDPREAPGELIHPTRFPPEVIAAERTRLGTHGFEAQYNCNPRPLEGGMIKRAWFRFFRIEDELLEDLRERPTGCAKREKSPAYVLRHKPAPGRQKGPLDLDWMTITVDATFGSVNDSASAVGLLCMGGAGLRRFVFDDTTRPMTFHATCDAIKAMIARWPARRILIELKANGAAIIEELGKQIGDGKVKGPDGKPVLVVIEPVNPEGGKTARAAAMVPAIEAGTVYLLDGAPWLEEFVGEVCVFPNAKRDDRVDAMSQCMTYYRGSDVTSKWGPWMRGARA